MQVQPKQVLSVSESPDFKQGSRLLPFDSMPEKLEALSLESTEEIAKLKTHC